MRLLTAVESTRPLMRNLVTRRDIILTNFIEAKVLMIGVFPHLNISAKLVPADMNDNKKNMRYVSFARIVSSNTRSERSIGLSEKITLE